MGCLYYPRKEISVSHAADCDGIRCYGEAEPTDLHPLSTIRAVDDEIIEWLERHEQFRRDRKGVAKLCPDQNEMRPERRSVKEPAKLFKDFS